MPKPTLMSTVMTTASTMGKFRCMIIMAQSTPQMLI